MVEIDFLRRRVGGGPGWQSPVRVVAVALAALAVVSSCLYADLIRARRQFLALESGRSAQWEAAELARQEQQVANLERVLNGSSGRRWTPILAGLAELGQTRVEWVNITGQGDTVTVAARTDHLDQVAGVMERATDLAGVAAVHLKGVRLIAETGKSRPSQAAANQPLAAPAPGPVPVPGQRMAFEVQLQLAGKAGQTG